MKQLFPSAHDCEPGAARGSFSIAALAWMVAVAAAGIGHVGCGTSQTGSDDKRGNGTAGAGGGGGSAVAGGESNSRGGAVGGGDSGAAGSENSSRGGAGGGGDSGAAGGNVGSFTIDLTSQQDPKIVLKNPHRGILHHYYDDRTDIYLGTASDLASVPGLSQIYIRLPWVYFEPSEGNYDWHLIDDVVNRFQPLGYRFGFRITVKETSPQVAPYATPQWVRDAGAQGVMLQKSVPQWEPNFGDPIFLEKFEAFQIAFAAKYGNQPWLDYIDIGSIGDWGEGHTFYSSMQRQSLATLRKHVDLFRRAFPTQPLTIGDDYVHFNLSGPDEQSFLAYLATRDVGIRDDSVMVDYFLHNEPAASNHSVVKPAYFSESYKSRLTVTENEHYGKQLTQMNWVGQNGSTYGAEQLLGAIALEHPSYWGYHGDASAWATQNPDFARVIANKVGYWYFMESAVVPSRFRPGSDASVAIKWENRGVAPAYFRYAVDIKLESATLGSYTQSFPDSGNRAWLDGTMTSESYRVSVPTTLPPGAYTLKLRLYHQQGAVVTPIQLGMSGALRDADGFYTLAMVQAG